ncbi:MAG TPA: hypothetical protein VN457_08415 [Chlamydiales bacterium]|nr:hypothetical protein [Chlamydiales bacterium]
MPILRFPSWPSALPPEEAKPKSLTKTERQQKASAFFQDVLKFVKQSTKNPADIAGLIKTDLKFKDYLIKNAAQFGKKMGLQAKGFQKLVEEELGDSNVYSRVKKAFADLIPPAPVQPPPVAPSPKATTPKAKASPSKPTTPGSPPVILPLKQSASSPVETPPAQTATTVKEPSAITAGGVTLKTASSTEIPEGIKQMPFLEFMFGNAGNHAMLHSMLEQLDPAARVALNKQLQTVTSQDSKVNTKLADMKVLFAEIDLHHKVQDSLHKIMTQHAEATHFAATVPTDKLFRAISTAIQKHNVSLEEKKELLFFCKEWVEKNWENPAFIAQQGHLNDIVKAGMTSGIDKLLAQEGPAAHGRNEAELLAGFHHTPHAETPVEELYLVLSQRSVERSLLALEQKPLTRTYTSQQLQAEAAAILKPLSKIHFQQLRALHTAFDEDLEFVSKKQEAIFNKHIHQESTRDLDDRKRKLEAIVEAINEHTNQLLGGEG